MSEVCRSISIATAKCFSPSGTTGVTSQNTEARAPHKTQPPSLLLLMLFLIVSALQALLFMEFWASLS